MMMKAVAKEVSTQEVFGEAGSNLIIISSKANVSEQIKKSLVFSVSEVARLLGVSKNTVYETTHTGQIPSIKWGRRILIPRVALMKMLDEAGNAKINEAR